ncbi:hypothetical protein TrLO_g2871 [Triparma laevis f. longispina]|uniref:Uncharacterized protein n=1 Tax=Triparma laevis f. longispina TaxID=1714387 RepID=A0A9W7CAA9_9STRA|nr:hypothetical protein TrLO_g2871 [Triparma laevis f. longispina]
MNPTIILRFLSISVLVVSIFSSDKNHDDTAQTLTADKQSSGTSWIDISDGVQDAGGNPILEPSDMLEWILGDPSLLDLDTGERYVFANEVFHGIIWYKAQQPVDSNGEFQYSKIGKVVGYPGAVRPFAHYDSSTKTVHLFYEQYQFPLYNKSKIWMKKGTVNDGKITWENDDVMILEPKLSWEKEGLARVGNPFVYFHPSKKQYVLYYSASSQHLPDSKVDEPVYLGMAVSDEIEGPYERVDNSPMVVEGLDNTNTIGLGSIKLVKGISQDYNQPIAMINRITDKDGVTGSTISLVKSENKGNSFKVVELDLIEPSLVEKDWKEAYCYGFDTGVDMEDENFVLVLYNGRNGWAHATETVGATRIKKDLFNV